MKLERELMRGAAPTAVLQVLAGGEKYGYELVEALARQSNGVLGGRLDARLDWRQVIASASLSDDLASAVHQVVSNSRLWRREKVDVATELVAHFQDGLDAGQSAKALLTAFGDAQAAAQLIRRAK